MRLAVIDGVTELAEADDRVFLLTGDLGFSVVERFAERFPSRYLNLGVAEQNMVGVATGLADDGFIPYVYSIVTFASLRPYEFIRNGPVLHRLPVRIIGVGGGFEYGPAGATHHGLEDIAVMRALPGLTVVAPADAEQAAVAVRTLHDIDGPIYFRIGKDDRARVPGLAGRFRLGRVEITREGEVVLIVTAGAAATIAHHASELLAERGVAVGVAVAASISPAPVDDLRSLARQYPVIVTLEAHSVNGGIGSMVCEVVAEAGGPTRVRRCGVRGFHARGGSEQYLLRAHRLGAEDVAAVVEHELALTAPP